jgi:hypothetical protein
MRLPLTALALALSLAACASTGGGMLAAGAPRALPDAGPVQVAWADPATFTELRQSRNAWEAARGTWLTDLARYLRTRAEARLPAGEQLQVTILDIDRAGEYEPWRRFGMQDVRILRDIYPPRMTLRFQRLDADGRVLAEGERTLSDPAFLLGSSPMRESDPLRYEKRMIDGWVRREFREDVAGR